MSFRSIFSERRKTMQKDSLNYDKWKALSSDENDHGDGGDGIHDGQARKSLSLHSLLNSLQLLKRVADEKLMEGEKLQQLSTYSDAISLYKDILHRVQSNNHFLEMHSADPLLIHEKRKLIVILYSCHLNIACGDIRLRLYDEALHHCDCAIGLMTVYHNDSEETLISLLRAKYFKCFALLRLENVHNIDLANSEVQSMKGILMTRFSSEQQERLLKDYSELFLKVEQKMQKYENDRKDQQQEEEPITPSEQTEDEEQEQEDQEEETSPVPPQESLPRPLPSPPSILSTPKYLNETTNNKTSAFPFWSDESSPRLNQQSSEPTTPDVRFLRLQQILGDLEDCERKKLFPQVIDKKNMIPCILPLIIVFFYYLGDSIVERMEQTLFQSAFLCEIALFPSGI
jgi:hypothetical protein